MLCGVAVVFLLTCVTSIKVSASVPIALVFLCYLVFIPTALAILGLRGAMLGSIRGLRGIYAGSSSPIRVRARRIGVFVEEFNDGVAIERLGGMSQPPNHVGRTALIGLLLSVYFVRVVRHPSVRIALGMAMLVFVAAGVLAMSRTALLGAIICLVVLNLDCCSRAWALPPAGWPCWAV